MLSRIALAAAAACCAAAALAQTYPSKPIRLVVRAVEKQMEPDSAQPIGSTPKEFAAYIATEQVRWKEVVQKAHVRVD